MCFGTGVGLRARSGLGFPVWRWWENNTILTWLSQRRPEDKPISSMVSLQHMALKFSPELSACFGLSGLSLDGVSRDQWTLEHE